MRSSETPSRHSVIWPGNYSLHIVRREFDDAQALADGLFRVEGAAAILAHIGSWFPARR